MSYWDYIRSAVIFVAAIFILNNFFISLTIFEAVILIIFTIICVFHTMDIRDDVMKKLDNRRDRKKNGSSSVPPSTP